MANRKKPTNKFANSSRRIEPADLSLEDTIRRRAYELYERRGKADGGAEEDWFRAEAEILTHVRGGKSHGG